MRILLTNDDGIGAKGLSVLEKVAHSLTHDVWCIAPEIDQSGSGHSLTLRKPLRIREINHKKYAVSGTPTDCVLVAITHLMKDHKPTLVLSGINNGGNIGEDVTYSGTVSAVMESVMLGIPAIAMSLVFNYDDTPKWETAAHFAPKVIQDILDQQFDNTVFMNVNFPDMLIKDVKGIKVTRQGQRRAESNLVSCTDPRGTPYYWIGGGQSYADTPVCDTHTDLGAIRNGFISVTPLCLDLTHYPTYEKLQGAFHT